MQDQTPQALEGPIWSNYELRGFRGYFLLQLVASRKFLTTGDSFQCILRNSEKFKKYKSKVINLAQTLIVTLSKCGDIQTNLGPVNFHRKRTKDIISPPVITK